MYVSIHTYKQTNKLILKVILVSRGTGIKVKMPMACGEKTFGLRVGERKDLNSPNYEKQSWRS